MKKLRFSKEGFGKVRRSSTTLQDLKEALEGRGRRLGLRRTPWPHRPEDEEAARHMAKKVQEEIDAEIVKDLLREAEAKKLKEALEEFSTKIGEKDGS